MADRTRYLAEYDVMTNLANRSQFQARLADLDGRAGHAAIGALLLVDLDECKQINDTHGHALGDECLREVARRLRGCRAGADLVARIGGDEFVVLLGAASGSVDAAALADEIVTAMRLPFVWSGRTLQLDVSVGAALRQDAAAGDTLFRNAYSALYAAKAAGRNTGRLFTAEPERQTA